MKYAVTVIWVTLSCSSMALAQEKERLGAGSEEKRLGAGSEEKRLGAGSEEGKLDKDPLRGNSAVMAADEGPYVLPSGPPYAGPGGKNFGFGFQQTLAGLVGPHVEYHHWNRLVIDGMAGLTSYSSREDSSITAFAIAAAAFYKLIWFEQGGLMAGARTIIGVFNETPNGATKANTHIEFAVEIPARVEVFFARTVALHFEVGLLIAKASSDGSVFTGNPHNTLAISLGWPRANYLGNVGLTAYFF